MSERILIGVVIIGLGLEAWQGWGKNPNTPLPAPWLFTSYLVVVALVGVVAIFSTSLAAVILAGVLIAIMLGAVNPLLASGTTSTGPVSQTPQNSPTSGGTGSYA